MGRKQEAYKRIKAIVTPLNLKADFDEFLNSLKVKVSSYGYFDSSYWDDDYDDYYYGDTYDIKKSGRHKKAKDSYLTHHKKNYHYDDDDYYDYDEYTPYKGVCIIYHNNMSTSKETTTRYYTKKLFYKFLKDNGIKTDKVIDEFIKKNSLVYCCVNPVDKTKLLVSDQYFDLHNKNISLINHE